ncbi:MAG: ATP-binding protein [Pseudomonadota bacterium]
MSSAEQAIYVQQVRMLFSQARIAFAGGIVVSGVCIFVLWRHCSLTFLLSWGAAIVACNIYLLVLSVLYDKHSTNLRLTRLFDRLYNVQAVLHGASWGVLGPVVLLVDQGSMFSFALIISLGMASGAMATTGALFHIYLSYMMPVVLPSAVAIALFDGPGFFSALSPLTIFYIGIMSMAAYNYKKSLVQSWRLQYENKALFDNLLNEKTVAEQAVRKLDAEVRERQKIEIALRDAMGRAEAANVAKSRFLANMSHEMRTPLTAIIGFSEMLLDVKTTMNERIEGIRAVMRNGSHLLQLINDLLDLSKIEAGKLVVTRAPVDYVDMLYEIESYCLMQAKNKNIYFNISYQYPLPAHIVTDALRLKQILLNLCSNALKFTASGGVSLVVACDAQAATMTFEVRDTGIGMSPEQQSRLFQSFEQADSSTTRKYGGTGLGLAVSQRLAKMLGGSISVHSESGNGSRFILHMDIAPLGALSIVRDADITQKRHAIQSMPHDVDIHLSGSVLVVEDTADIQRLVGQYLQRMGIGFVVANNGREAVDLAGERAFDVILMDMQMPVMDGATAVKKLRAAGYLKPIVALTASALPEEQARAFELGFDGFIAKPIHRQIFVETLSKYLTPGAVTGATQAPVISELIKDMPELSDTIIEFLEGLPRHIGELATALATLDWRQMKERAHALKGLGGSYGFQTLTELAKEMEFQIAKQDVADVTATLQKMQQTVVRIVAGREVYERLLGQGGR